MKRSLIISALLAGIIFFGCSKDNTIVDPVSTGVKAQKSLIKLPTPNGLTSEAEVSLSFNVNGEAGAYQEFSLNFPGTSSTVFGNYTFPANAFSGDKIIKGRFRPSIAK